MQFNYHCHSNYCDGIGNLESYVLAAIEKSFKSIGFSSHSPVPFENKWSMKREKLPNYLSEIQELRVKYKSEIQIYAGLEVDYLEGLEDFTKQLLRSELDFTIFSVHYLKTESNEFIEVDGATDAFLKHFKEFWKQDQDQFVHEYFQAFHQIIDHFEPTIIGHFDKIKLHQFENGKSVIDTKSSVYKKELILALEKIAKTEALIEINTRAIYKKGLSETYPSFEWLKLAREMNIPLVLNSDSHSIQELDASFKIVQDQLIENGFETINVLYNNEWQPVKLTSNGLIF